jgi:hypothetical protein
LEGLDISIAECPNYHTALKEILSKKEYQRYYPELYHYYRFSKLPKSLQINLMLADMQMVWNQTEKTFVSQGQIGVAICGKREVNRYVPGIIEIKKASSNKGRSEIRMYFEVGSEWFYFEYKSNKLSAVSSVKAFNDCVSNTPANKRELKADPYKDLPSYTYSRGAVSLKVNFLKRYPKNENE